MGINKEYCLEIEVISPLSVGAGQEQNLVKGIDFVIDGGNLYKLNISKLLKNGIDANTLSTYLQNKDEKGIIKKLQGKLDAVSDAKFSIPVQYVSDVKTCIKNSFTGNPIIPGSSLKGAIMSILSAHFDTKGDTSKLGSMNDGSVFGRFIRVTDVEFEDTKLYNTKIFNLQGDNGRYTEGGWKHSGVNGTNGTFSPNGFNTVYECIAPKSKSCLKIKLSEALFERVNHEFAKREKGTVMHGGLPKIFEIVNANTRNYLKKEKQFFLKFAADRTDEVEDFIDNMLAQMPEDNSSCILKMAAGSGFHSITGDWQFDDYTIAPLDRKRKKDGKVNPKSRKIVVGDNGTLGFMGFVKLRLISDEKFCQYEQKKKESLIAKQERYREQEKRERLLEKQRLEALQKRAEQEAKFNQRVQEVVGLMEREEYIEALDLYNEISNEYQGFNQSSVALSLLKSKANIQKLEIEEQERMKEDEEERRKRNESIVNDGLQKILNEKYEFGPNEGKYKLVTFKRVEQAVNNYLKKAGLNQNEKLPEEQQDAFVKTVVRILKNQDKQEKKDWANFNSKIWKQIKIWIGDEVAKQIFEKNEL